MLASTWSYDSLSTFIVVSFNIGLLSEITTQALDHRDADDPVAPLRQNCHDAAAVVPRRSCQKCLHRIGNLLECGVMIQPNWHLLEALSNRVGCALMTD